MPEKPFRHGGKSSSVS